jgi:hypothetical protein
VAAAAVLGVTALVAAGCGGSSPGGTPSGVTIGDHPSQSASPQRNKAATEAEVERLFGLAELPPGASLTSDRPHELSGPAMGTPSDSTLVDKVGYWHVEESADTAYRWINARTPKGLTQSGSSGGGGSNGVTESGVEWSEPDHSYATELQLDESVTSVGSGAVIRADGLGIWLDPRPVHDTATGSRLRVTLAAGCPHSDRGDVGVTNTGSDLNSALLPSAAPTAGLICQYGGLNATPRGGLAATATLTAAAARRLAIEAGGRSLAHSGGGVTSCPMDDGGVDVLALAFPGRSDVDLWISATGCEFISNGSIRGAGGLDVTRWIPRSKGPL